MRAEGLEETNSSTRNFANAPNKTLSDCVRVSKLFELF